MNKGFNVEMEYFLLSRGSSWGRLSLAKGLVIMQTVLGPGKASFQILVRISGGSSRNFENNSLVEELALLVTKTSEAIMKDRRRAKI